MLYELLRALLVILFQHRRNKTQVDVNTHSNELMLVCARIAGASRGVVAPVWFYTSLRQELHAT